MARTKVRILSPVKIDGERYETGADIEMDEKYAVELVAAGAAVAIAEKPEPSKSAKKEK